MQRNRENGCTNAKIAQLVEHDLAKVGVAGSSPVFRSIFSKAGEGDRLTEIVQAMSGWRNW